MSDLRQEIAAEAAREVVESGLDYASAKRKAARHLGARPRELPSDEAVEDAVREYLAIFAADTQPTELRALREVARQWMLRLAPFRPHVSGAVWRGTATRLSSVRLDLYCDDPKAVPLMLIDRGVAYELDDLGDPGEETPVLTVGSHSSTLGEQVTVHLIVRDADALRGALKPDSRGHRWRGSLAELEAMLNEEDAR